jgi:hypothetical protein
MRPQNLTEAASKHPDADVLVNFSSFRSVHSSCMEALNSCPTLRVLAIIAEGVPESQVCGGPRCRRARERVRSRTMVPHRRAK